MPEAPEPSLCRHCGLPLDPEPRRPGPRRQIHPACQAANDAARAYRAKGINTPEQRRKWRLIAEENARAG